MDVVCIECEGDLKFYMLFGSNFIKCVKKCLLFYKFEKGLLLVRCEVKKVKKKMKNSE